MDDLFQKKKCFARFKTLNEFVSYLFFQGFFLLVFTFEKFFDQSAMSTSANLEADYFFMKELPFPLEVALTLALKIGLKRVSQFFFCDINCIENLVNLKLF